MSLLRRNKRLGLVFLISLLVFVFVPSAMAFEGRGDDNVTIEADEVIEDDLYVGANSFVLNGVIKGDLIIGAQTIVINGVVEGDLWVGGQSVEINGSVLGDARIGGSAVELGEGAVIGEDLIVFGYGLHNKSGSLVEEGMVFGGYQALLEGDITEDVWAGVNSLTVNGRIGGNLTAEVGDQSAPPVNPYQFMPGMPAMPVVAAGLTLSNNAEIGGDFTYRAPQSFDVPTGAVGGELDYTQETINSDGEAQPSAGRMIWEHVRRFITLALIGALLVWKAPVFVTRLNEQMQDKPLPSLGWGAVVYFAVPFIVVALFVASILLALLLGGLQFGNLSGVVIFVLLAAIFAFMVVFVLTLLYLTKIVVGYFVGSFILQKVNPELAETPYWPLLLGLLLVVIIIAVPYLGGLLNLLIAMAGVGALWLLLREGKASKEKTFA
ncbi:MAG: hypothetical protein GY803_03760 [Chloroflexi bacterium]|nr:hypothetical protein [Chloroflexota bacterium]